MEATNKVWVRLADKSSIFHNVQNNETISGAGAIPMTPTKKFNQAVTGGALVKMTEGEAKAYNKEIGFTVPDPEADKKAVADAVAKEKEFDDFLVQGNKWAADSDFKNALEAYTMALELKPSNAVAKKKVEDMKKAIEKKK